MSGIISEINYYNGIIKGCFFSLEDEEGYREVHITEYNVRPGYKAYYNSNLKGTILVEE